MKIDSLLLLIINKNSKGKYKKMPHLLDIKQYVDYKKV